MGHPVFTYLFRSFLFLRRFSKEKVIQKWQHTLYKNVAYEVLWVCLCEISGVCIINKSVFVCVCVEQGHFFMFIHGFCLLWTVQCGCVYVCIFITYRDVGVYMSDLYAVLQSWMCVVCS